jgi:hypothetical protein
MNIKKYLEKKTNRILKCSAFLLRNESKNEAKMNQKLKIKELS